MMHCNKKAVLGWILAVALIMATGCREIGPNIALTDQETLQDTTYIDNELPETNYKRVLVEEFTGVQCTNCPDGHAVTSSIKNDLGDSVVLVAIHNSNPLAKPFKGYRDFRTDEGVTISQNVGGNNLPSASIDRFHFNGENDVAVIFRNKWPSYTNQRLQQEAPVAIELTSDFDAASRELKVRVKLHYTKAVDSTNNLSLMITEDGIISPQSQPNGSVDSNYVHDHVLRDMITSVSGMQVHSTTEQGRVVIRELLYEMPQDLVAENCHVVAFVHRVGGSQRVLQAAEVAVK